MSKISRSFFVFSNHFFFLLSSSSSFFFLLSHLSGVKKVLETRFNAQEALRKDLKESLKFPMSQGRTLTLADGRVLGYELYGAGVDDTKVKKYLVLCHGTPGSRLFMTPEMEQAAKARGIQVIIPERPGYGLSTPQPTRTILSGAEDVKELLQHLGIARQASSSAEEAAGEEHGRDAAPKEDRTAKVAVMGYSAGGPFALACAQALPDLVSSVILIGAVSPPDTPHSTRGMTLINKVAYFLARTWLWAVEVGVKSEAADLQKDPIKKLREILATTIGDNQTYLMNPAIERVFAISGLEMYSRPSGAEAEALDYWLFCHPWGFELQNLPKEIKYHVWYGLTDESVVPAMGEHFNQVLPGCHTTPVEEKGHLLFFEVWGDALNQALSS